jgi:hypothetical protein
MGWLYAPYVFTCFMWVVIMYTEPEDEQLFDLSGVDFSQPPRFLRIIGGGFITCYIDNILACATNADTATKLNKRLWRNFTRVFGFRMKDWCGAAFPDGEEHPKATPPHYTPERLRREEFAYLGAILSWIATGRLEWRVKTPAQGEFPLSGGKSFEALLLMQVCGRLCWHHVLSLRSRLSFQPAAELMRLVNATVRKEGGWKATRLTVPSELIKGLSNLWAKAIANAPHQLDAAAHPTTREVWLCTDSSESAYGWVLFGPNGAVHQVRKQSWGVLVRAHIFVKELVCAVLAIQAMHRLFPRDTLDVRLGIDNSAAGFSLQMMFSSNLIVLPYLQALSTLLAERHSRLEIYGLRSEDNVSDVPSRLGDLLDAKGQVVPKYAELLATTWRVMQAASKGIISNRWQQNYRRANGATSIRHPQGPDESGEEPDLALLQQTFEALLLDPTLD